MSIRLQHPLPGATLTDRFGWRSAIPGVVNAELHNGQDFAAPAGTPIRAAHDGIVRWTGWDGPGGNGIIIGTATYSTGYYHLQAPATLLAGRAVRAGDVIGYVGSTGAATGPHLHFMLTLPGGPVDPMPYLTATTPTSSTTKRGVRTMFMIYTDAYKNDKARPGRRWAVFGPGMFKEIYDQKEANAVKAALVCGPSVKVDGPTYRDYRAAAQAGM